MKIVNMRKWRLKLLTCRRLEIKILLEKQFPEKKNTAKLSGSIADASPEKRDLVILMFNDLVWKLIDSYLRLQKGLVFIFLSLKFYFLFY